MPLVLYNSCLVKKQELRAVIYVGDETITWADNIAIAQSGNYSSKLAVARPVPEGTYCNAQCELLMPIFSTYRNFG